MLPANSNASAMRSGSNELNFLKLETTGRPSAYLTII